MSMKQSWHASYMQRSRSAKIREDDVPHKLAMQLMLLTKAHLEQHANSKLEGAMPQHHLWRAAIEASRENAPCAADLAETLQALLGARADVERATGTQLIFIYMAS